MAEKLVIVESPAKAKTIGKMLGADYRILSSMGHVRDLPPRAMGVDFKNDFKPKYVNNPNRADTIKNLKKEAKKASDIYLAPDPDREGEAIAWHLKEILKDVSKSDFHRVTFHEITKNAVLSAFSQSSHIDQGRVNSQQARRILDRIVGWRVSPLLSRKIYRAKSAGRVQSVALRICCEREKEIQIFKPKEYWNFSVDLKPEGKEGVFEGKLFKIDGDKFEIGNKTDADKILNSIKDAGKFNTDFKEVKPVRKHAPPPFITSTLQQAASSYLKYNSKRTMRVAQQLYEGISIGSGDQLGLITYMRTDSFNLSGDAVNSCREYIKSNFGKEYLPSKPNFYRSKSSAQEAHEAIRPTDITLTPEKVKNFLDASQLKLYKLIWNRFVACQMSSSVQERTTVDSSIIGKDGKKYTFKTNATVMVFDGYSRMLNFAQGSKDGKKKQEASVLAGISENDKSTMTDLKSEQKFTEAPSRYSEASLIKEMEANGIGRPSTYASIVNTIQTRKYVANQKGKLKPTGLGMKVNDFLLESLPELFQVGFTAQMEKRLDEIEDGRIEWTKMLHDFYSHFSEWLDSVKHKNSPESLKAESLLSLIAKSVEEWEKPAKIGRKKYDDRKFFNSVKKTFEDENKITGPQWNAVLKLALKYESQISELEKTAVDNNFLDELEKSRKEKKEITKKAEKESLTDEEFEKYRNFFRLFDDIELKNSVGSSVSDQDFVDSLQKRVCEKNKKLTDKQKKALYNLSSKYFIEYPELKSGLENLGISIASEENFKKDPELDRIFTYFSSFDKWDEPVKKGKRVYDDKKFIDSLESQYKSGKKLSSKQIYALKKIFSKYKNGNSSKKSKTGNNTENTASETDHQIEKNIEFLNKIKTWNEPVKKRKRRFDDKKFFNSLKTQYESGKKLSFKQKNALEKLFRKYSETEN